MSLTKFGGLAALICATTYMVGFALLVTVLAPLGFGTSQIDPDAVVAFAYAHTGILLAWNSTIYIVNALALAVLVVALAKILSPDWASVSHALGLIWAALVLGAGMIANVSVEQAAMLFATDPEAAADLWSFLHTVELGLGGGNEIAGGAWILVTSLAAHRVHALPKVTNGLGLVTGSSGLVTVLPATGEVAGAVFGLGAIAWFLAVSWTLTMGTSRLPQPATS